MKDATLNALVILSFLLAIFVAIGIIELGRGDVEGASIAWGCVAFITPLATAWAIAGGIDMGKK